MIVGIIALNAYNWGYYARERRGDAQLNKVSPWILCVLCTCLVFGVSAAAYGQSAGLSAAPRSLLSPEALEQALTQRYIKHYSSPDGIRWLKSVIERGSIYIPFIRDEIARRDLPAELLYLPVIESDYLSTAKSRAGAVGLWQFMENSIEPFDIRINDWVDERRDFWKATHGALSKLEDNHRSLGDWPLALAAYNAGLGGVSRVIEESGGHGYWELSEERALKTETIHYVPKLLAVAYIMSCPGEFGVDLGQGDTLEWTRLRVGKALDLDWLVAEAGIDTGLLKNGNRELNSNMTPPDSTWQIKVPRESAAAIAAVLERVDLNHPPDNDREPFTPRGPPVPIPGPGQGPFPQAEVPDQVPVSGEFLPGCAPAGLIAALPVVPRQKGIVPFHRTCGDTAVNINGIFPLEIAAKPGYSRLDNASARDPPAEVRPAFFDG